MGYKTGGEEGLVPRNGIADMSDGRPAADVRSGTERGRLIQEMQAERDRASNLRVGNNANRMARYDMGASAKVYGLRALATIVEIMENVNEPSPVRLAAAREVLDRGFGRPKQVTEVGGLDGDEIRNRLVIEFVGVPKRDEGERESSREVGGFGAEKADLAQGSRAPLGTSGGTRDLSNDPWPVDARCNSGVPGGWQRGVAREVAKTVPRTQAHVNQAWVNTLTDVQDVEGKES